jgi:hypothetical protein
MGRFPFKGLGGLLWLGWLRTARKEVETPSAEQLLLSSADRHRGYL